MNYANKIQLRARFNFHLRSLFAAFIMAFQWLSSFFVMQIRSRVVSGFVFCCRFHSQDQTREKIENLVVKGAKDFPAFV